MHIKLTAFAFTAGLLTATTLFAEEISPVVGDGWTLVWNDEFEETEIDTSKWGWETDCWGGGNNELQCYTDRPENSFVRDGKLVIQARKESFTGPAEPLDWDSNAGERTLPYTSARLRTLGQGDWKYGRIEVRAKIPRGQGIWPAIWMLPTDWVYGGWAASGEIDIMEAVNLSSDEDMQIHGTLHYGREWPGQVSSGTSYTAEGFDPIDNFHTYALEWSRREMRWYVDDVHYATQKSSGWYAQVMGADGYYEDVPGDAPFDQRFHLLMNVAVGGNWPGEPDAETEFPAEMEVDFVRVFSCEDNPESLRGCKTVDRSATRVFGNTPPEIVRLEYDESLLGQDVVEGFGEEGISPFLLGQYVANGSVTMTSVEEDERGFVTNLAFNTDESVVYWQAPFGFVRLRRSAKGNPSFSQEGEDLLLDSIFFRLNGGQRKDTGFYLDVGAHHPFIYSNTARLFNRGWTGINIDPSDVAIRLFERTRPRDLNLRNGVGGESGELTYYKYDISPALNTFSEDVVKYHTSTGMHYSSTETIPIEPLKELLKQHIPSGQKIDLMNIDVEGFDFDVVASNDWAVWRPSVVAIEQHALSLAEVGATEIGAFFTKHGYVAWSKTASTVFYVDAAEVGKLR